MVDHFVLLHTNHELFVTEMRARVCHASRVSVTELKRVPKSNTDSEYALLRMFPQLTMMPEFLDSDHLRSLHDLVDYAIVKVLLCSYQDCLLII
jgi:hypothetical protein